MYKEKLNVPNDSTKKLPEASLGKLVENLPESVSGSII